MQYVPQRLQLTITTPEVVTEGETFNIGYRVKNIGNTVFPGGVVNVELSWPSLEPRVYQPIVINRPLAPNDEFEENRYGQTPLVAGYTWFHVHQAVDSNGANIEIFNASGAQIYPPQQLSVSSSTVTYFRQPAHAVRARTHEEIYTKRSLIYTRWAMWIAVGSLAAVALIQIVDWMIRFFL
jgi:hypothetical protein